MSMFSTWNYLVPATGRTNAYGVGNLVGAAVAIDFNQVSNNGVQFQPSGVVIDNINGSSDLNIVINKTGQNIKCPMGKQMGVSFPAPSDLTVTVTGNGANVYFVDYPVIPYLF